MKRIAIQGSGLQCALGDAVTTLLALRAGQSGFEEHPRWVDNQGEPMVLAPSPALDPLLPADQRLAQLSLPAIQSALDGLDPEALQHSGYPLRLFLGLPSPQAGLDEALLGRFLQQLGDALKETPWPIQEIIPIRTGRTAGLMAIKQGADHLQQGKAPFCLAGAVDSWINIERLQWLDELELLHSAHQARGIIPGEGAGFCLLSRVTQENPPDAPCLLDIAQAQEPFRPYTHDTPTGNALTAACQAALEPLPQEKQLQEIYADLNGERWRATEYGFASLRLAPWLKRTDSFNEIAGGLGDIGAATGPVMLNLALAAAQKGYAQGGHALIWTASGTGERAATLIHAPAEKARLKVVV